MRKPATILLIAAIGLLLGSGVIRATYAQAIASGRPLITPAACWSVVSSSGPGTYMNSLNGVAAISSSDIWAVGNSRNDRNSSSALIEHWDGVSWSIVASPSRSPSYASLSGVAAVSSNDVWAVGADDYGTLVEHWDGNSWSIIPSPNPSQFSNGLQAVTAISPSNVWAVGSTGNSSASYTLVEHWDGASWSIVSSPSPSLNVSTLNGISAIAPNDIWAVGVHDYSTLVEHWSGTYWNVVPSPNPGPYENILNAVTATSHGDIWAVGEYYYRYSVNPLVEHWDGANWSVVPSPDTGSQDNRLSAVTAISSSDVWMVGYYGSSNSSNTLVEHWDGTSWNIVPSPSFGSYINDLHAVAAISQTDVWAVGDYYYATGTTLVEHYSASGCNTPTPGGPTNTPVPTLTPQPTICPNPFVDINTSIFFPAINTLYCRGDINGTDATHYSPTDTSTRGQFAKLIALAFGLPIYTPSSGQDFTDVPPTYFAYAYIESGYNARILSGFDANTCAMNGAAFPCFLPNTPITRGQLTKLVVGAAHYPSYTPLGGEHDFSDVPPSNIFYTSIETAYNKGVVTGYPDGSFHPNNPIRRDEMAQIVYMGITSP